jgi:hypothetical protein
MDPNTGPVNDDQPQPSEWSPESPLTDPLPSEQAIPPPGQDLLTTPPADDRTMPPADDLTMPPQAAWAAPSSGTSPAPEDPSLAWPMPSGGFATIAPPPPRPVSKARHRAIVAAALRRLFAGKVHQSAAGSVVAIYQGQATDPNLSAVDNIVVYAGFNVNDGDDPSDAVAGAVRGFARRVKHPNPVPLSGGAGVGDTSFACVTGDGAEIQGVPSQVTACFWATDRTLGFFVRQGPDPGARKLSALMLKMWPKLVHH